MKVCILIKNSKYGHDYEVYSETEAKTVDLEKEQEKWHQELIDECGIHPSEDDYVAWYNGGQGEPFVMVVKEASESLEDYLDRKTGEEIELERKQVLEGC
jgi:hypothetical protein